jgi:hypothetical protein
MRSERSLEQLVQVLDDVRRATIERLRAKPSAEDVALKEEVDWAVGCLRFCRRLSISPEDTAFRIVRPVQTPSAEVRLVSDNETDDACMWTELRLDGKRVRLVDGDVVVLKGHR